MSFAYVTLLTSDSYLPGALVLAKSLLDTKTPYPKIVLICGEVSQSCRQVLANYYDRLIDAPLIRSTDFENLKLLGRTELDVTFSKVHVFNPALLPFKRVAFLDADTVIIQSIDDIFSYLDNPETVFAAAPDIGWPDCFNSGVFVCKPSPSIFKALLEKTKMESFDGGDQGLLNTYFSTWATEYGDSKRTARLPFTFNVTPSSFYSYIPAFIKFKGDIRVLHFIGASKPWHWSRFFNGDLIPMYLSLI
jgi:lipopolysaccharide biosynthesis glycosyltransferase